MAVVQSNNTSASTFTKKYLSFEQNRLYVFLIPCFLAIVTFITYAPSFWYGFQFDDKENILKFFDIRHLTFKELVYSSPRWISKWLNTIYYSLGEFNPLIYRLSGVLFHIMTGIAIYALFYKAISNIKQDSVVKKYALVAATVISMLFLLHPVQTQTVSYIIQGQLEGLATLALVLLLLAITLFKHATKKSVKWVSFATIIVITLLGCGTKEIFIVAPLLTLVFDWFFLAEGSIKSIVSRFWIYVLIGSIIAISFYYYSSISHFSLPDVAYNNFGNSLTNNSNTHITRYQFLISQFKVIIHYLYIFFVPQMSVDYDWKLVDHFFSFDCLAPLLLLLCSASFTLNLLVKNKLHLIAFSIIWFFITILPRASIIPACELLADYKTHSASIGVFFFMAYIFVYAIEYGRKYLDNYQSVLVIIMSCFTLIFAYSSYSRNIVWSNDETFWADIINKAPLRARGHNNYGTALQDKKDHEGASKAFIKAIELDEKYPDPWINLSISQKELGKVDQAINSIDIAIRLNKYQPEAHLNRGLYLYSQNKLDEAEKSFLKAIKYRKHYGKAWNNLSVARASKKDFKGALEAARYAAMKTDHIQKQSFLTWGKSALELNDFEEAIKAFSAWLSYEPHSLDAAVQLAQSYVLSKNYTQALRIYSQISPHLETNPLIWFNIGLCHKKLKNYSEAIEAFNRSLKYMSMPQAQLKVASCYAKLNKLDQAKEMLQSVISGYNSKQVTKKAQSKLKIINQVGKTIDS